MWSLLGSSNLPTILSQCNGTNLLLGCRAVGCSNLFVAAIGNRADVLYNCGLTATCTKRANGFDNVTGSSCDVASTNTAYRLCWHTQNNGGYRCGSIINLNLATTWERVIYHES